MNKSTDIYEWEDGSQSVSDLPQPTRAELAQAACFNCPLSDCKPLSRLCPMSPKYDAGAISGRYTQTDWGALTAADIAWIKQRVRYYPGTKHIIIYANGEELLAHGIRKSPRLRGRVWVYETNSAVLARRLGLE
jgi:hypothetical protein